MNQPTALIVEDNEDIARIFELTLKSANFSTEIASEGKVADQRLASGTLPDILICDLHLPEMNGQDILENNLDRLQANGTKIILVTADGQGMQLSHLVDMVLLKPVTPSQLSNFSTRLLNKKPSLVS